MSFGTKLKILLNEKKISQAKLANYLNISQQSVSRYINDIAEPDINTILILSKYFGVSTDYLLGLSDDDNVIINSELNESENYLLSQFRKMNSDKQSEMIDYAKYLASKNKVLGNDVLDLSDFDDLAKAEIKGFVNGFKKEYKGKNLA